MTTKDSQPTKNMIEETDIQSPTDSPTGLPASAGYALVYVPQWQEKLGWILFPSNHIDLPEMPNRKDGLICHVTVQLSWLDRLRMLISGKLEVTAKTATENVIGANVTATGVSVIPPTWLQRHNDEMRDRHLEKLSGMAGDWMDNRLHACEPND